jgi:hypothetical protein
MNPRLNQILRSRGFAWFLHAALWLLLYLTILGLGGQAPEFQESTSFSTPPQSWAPVANLNALFSTAAWPKSLAATNTANLFFTTNFVAPAPPPPPPPPSTRKIPVSYQGFYQAPDSPKMVMVVVETNNVIARVGAPIATNHFIADASLLSMTLTNTAGQTNLIPLNTKKEIEVPAK